MIAGGDQDGVNIRPGQQFLEVPVKGAILVPVMRVGLLLDLLAAAALHVADGDKLNVLFRQHDAEVILAAGAHADAGKDNPLARRHRPVTPQGPRGDDAGDCQARSCQGRSFKEFAPVRARGLLACFHAVRISTLLAMRGEAAHLIGAVRAHGRRVVPAPGDVKRKVPLGLKPSTNRSPATTLPGKVR